VVDSPAVVCARGMVMRFGADMVVCVEVCGPVLALALKSGVVDDDGMGVESVVSRLERPALADGMFREYVVFRCQGEEMRMSVGGLCSRARLRALSPARARACEWMAGSELQVRVSLHKAAVMYIIATRKSEVRQVLSRSRSLPSSRGGVLAVFYVLETWRAPCTHG
jgi:hypothetical protein